jgi:SAM-dependent methyltransferase
MNRKERRAARQHDKRLPLPASAPLPTIDDMAAEARQHFDQRRFAPARKLCRDVLAHAPAHVDSLNLLGLMAQESAGHTAAVRFFQTAIAADPHNAATHYNIGLSYQVLKESAKAATHFRQAIELGLSGKDVGDFVMQSTVVSAYLDRMAAAWPSRPSHGELFGVHGIAAIAEDMFLCCALETRPLTGLALEGFLTETRNALLRLSIDAAPAFRGIESSIVRLCAALAQQCFINEYIYAVGEVEAREAADLRTLLQDRLSAGSEIPALLVAIVAAYRPLHLLTGADSLLRMRWPDDITGLLRQQLVEPGEEAQDRAAIPVLTAIADKSVQVRRQYEESPYPRWTIQTKEDVAASGAETRPGPDDTKDILIAGCGTGFHSIATAKLYANARILAVDVSLASLAYARRKTRDAGVRNIDYAQADIMNMNAVGRDFDRIESVGVLHHLDHPLAGWRTLLSLLRPGGLMTVGLYSAAARQGINAARVFVSERGYRATSDDIRACRQELIRREAGMIRKDLTSLADFYTISGCRDLLFNVMEHQFTIAAIKSFISEQRLSFLGFEIDKPTLDRFQRRFPGPDALLDLDRWERFEEANPQAFLGMYIFNVRSSG